MKAKEETEDVATAAFLEAPTRHRRRRRLGRSSASRLYNSQKANSFDRSSKGSSNDSDLGDDDGGKKEEEEEDDDDEKEEMEYLAPSYLQEDSGDDTDAYAPRSP